MAANVLAHVATTRGHGVEAAGDNLGAGMQHALEIDLIDTECIEEIRLIANLMIAAATTHDPLSPRSIDLALGIGGATL